MAEPLSLDDSISTLLEAHGETAIDAAATTSAHEIRPGLFVGGIAAALDPDEVHERRLTRVVNCLHEANAKFGEALPPPARGVDPAHAPAPRLEYLTLALEDTPSQPLLGVLPAAVDFIGDSLSSGHRVLVHCVAGMSRSVSICVAYLVRSEGITAARALVDIQRVRPCANPNKGFRLQLREWEARVAAARAEQGLPPLKALGGRLRPRCGDGFMRDLGGVKG